MSRFYIIKDNPSGGKLFLTTSTNWSTNIDNAHEVFTDYYAWYLIRALKLTDARVAIINNLNADQANSEIMEKFYVICDSRYIPGQILYLQGNYKSTGNYWTPDILRAKVFASKSDAEYAAAPLKYNNARVISSLEYYKASVNKASTTEDSNQINQSNQSIFTNMFENLQNSFNGLFGKVEAGKCKLTMNGNIAVKCSNGYKTYNVKKGTLTNVTNFCFSLDDKNAGFEMFFVVPTNHVSIGDIILVSGKPKCVIEVNKKVITVIDYENSEVRQIVPERHIFMGSTYFYGKIISMFGDTFKKGKGMKSMIQMMLISQMMGNGSNQNNGMMGNIGNLMAMSMFFGKNSNPFEGMFDSIMDDVDTDDFMNFNMEDDDDDEEGEEGEEVKKPVSKPKTKKSR